MQVISEEVFEDDTLPGVYAKYDASKLKVTDFNDLGEINYLKIHSFHKLVKNKNSLMINPRIEQSSDGGESALFFKYILSKKVVRNHWSNFELLIYALKNKGDKLMRIFTFAKDNDNSERFHKSIVFDNFPEVEPINAATTKNKYWRAQSLRITTRVLSQQYPATRFDESKHHSLNWKEETNFYETYRLE